MSFFVSCCFLLPTKLILFSLPSLRITAVLYYISSHITSGLISERVCSTDNMSFHDFRASGRWGIQFPSFYIIKRPTNLLAYRNTYNDYIAKDILKYFLPVPFEIHPLIWLSESLRFLIYSSFSFFQPCLSRMFPSFSFFSAGKRITILFIPYLS